ncbi:uncharacterized protein M8220_000866 isoform 1-T1 [Acridotheres tristis]
MPPGKAARGRLLRPSTWKQEDGMRARDARTPTPHAVALPRSWGNPDTAENKAQKSPSALFCDLMSTVYFYGNLAQLSNLWQVSQDHSTGVLGRHGNALRMGEAL